MKSKVLTLVLAGLAVLACGEKVTEPKPTLSLEIVGVQNNGLANQTVPATTPIPLEARLSGAEGEVAVTWRLRVGDAHQSLGTGLQIAPSLDVGTHQIQVLAQTSSGQRAEGLVTFTIGPDVIGVRLWVCPEAAYPNWQPDKSCVQARITENPRKLEIADTLRFNGQTVAFQGDTLALPNPLPQGQHQLIYKACTKSGSACDSAVVSKEILPYPDLTLRLQAIREDCHVHTGYERMVVRLAAGNRQEEAVADASGQVFFPESQLAVAKDTILLTVRAQDGQDTTYIPVWKRITGDELRKGDPIGLIRRFWQICRGTYQGQIVPIRLLVAYRAGTGIGTSYFIRRKDYTTSGNPFWVYVMVAIPEGKETPVVLDSATVQISPTDSTAFWQALDILEAHSGRGLGKPTAWHQRPSADTLMTLVDINPNIGAAGVATFFSDKMGNITGGAVSFARADIMGGLADVTHELGGHALYGVGHVCGWVSPMGTGCNLGLPQSDEMTPDDVAHWRVMTRVVKFFQQTGVKDVLPTSLNGERVFIHGLEPELEPVEVWTGPAMFQTTFTTTAEGMVVKQFTIKRLDRKP